MQTASAKVVDHQEPRLPALIWVEGSPSTASKGLARALEREFRIYRGATLPPAAPERPSAVLCCLEGGEQEEDIASLVQSVKEEAPDAALVVLSPTLELSLICAAVFAGARGFLPAGMPPQQVVRAISVVLRGEMALPREILEAFVNWLNDQQREAADLFTLSERKLEILELATEGLSNAQIARKLFVSESTVKQHLRAAYKALGAKNRREARNLVWQAQQLR